MTRHRVRQSGDVYGISRILNSSLTCLTLYIFFSFVTFIFQAAFTRLWVETVLGPNGTEDANLVFLNLLIFVFTLLSWSESSLGESESEEEESEKEEDDEGEEEDEDGSEDG